jgi:hypothetical protein
MNKVLLSLFCLISGFGAFGQDTISADNKVFDVVEKEADFPGGAEAWKNFLIKNLNPNVPVKNGAPLGKYTVYVQFIVGKDGTVRDVVPLTKLGFGMENEVVQLLKKSGKWTPAIQYGRPVGAYRKQPVTFMVTADDLHIVTATPYVLYTGMDNEIMVDIKRVKNEDLALTITKGTITKGSNGSYIAKVKGTGRALLTITGKKGKEIATVSFEIMDKN